MSVLIATDLSPNSRAALLYGRAIADVTGQTISIVRAVELRARDMSRIVDSFDPASNLDPSSEAKEATERFVAEVLGTDDYDVRTTVGYPAADNILRCADELDATLIVAGTTGQSRLSEAFFGTTVSALVRQANCPVLAVPASATDTSIGEILAPLDLSQISLAALRRAGELAVSFDATLCVVHAINLPTASLLPSMGFVPPSPELATQARRRIQSMVEELGLADRSKILLHEGGAAGYIKTIAAERGSGLIVMSSHTRRGMEKLFLGSTTEKVLRGPPCPVLVVPAQEE